MKYWYKRCRQHQNLFSNYVDPMGFTFSVGMYYYRDKFRIWAKVIANMIDWGDSFDLGLALNENAANSKIRKTFDIWIKHVFRWTYVSLS